MGKESNEGSGELFVCLYSLGHNVSHNLLRLGTFESVKSNMQAVALAFLSCLRTRNDKDGAQGEGEGEDYCRETHLHVKILVTLFFHQYFFSSSSLCYHHNLDVRWGCLIYYAQTV